MSTDYKKLLKNLSYRYGIHSDKFISLPARPKYHFQSSIRCTYPFKIDDEGEVKVAEWFKALLFVYQNDGEVTWSQLIGFYRNPTNLQPLRINKNVFEWASDYKKNRGHYKLTSNAKEYIEIVLGLIKSLSNMKTIKKWKYVLQNGMWVPEIVWQYIL